MRTCAFLLSAAFVIGLCGCDSNKPATQPPNSAGNTPAVVTPSPAKGKDGKDGKDRVGESGGFKQGE